MLTRSQTGQNSQRYKKQHIHFTTISKKILKKWHVVFQISNLRFTIWRNVLAKPCEFCRVLVSCHVLFVKMCQAWSVKQTTKGCNFEEKPKIVYLAELIKKSTRAFNRPEALSYNQKTH